ncbi:MAG: protein phosphatase 2C domain-containing protein [Candidatus Humimicrobiia bacterium]
MKTFKNKRTTKILIGAKTDPGMVRKHNEDNYLIDEKINLFLLADGMGGHLAGETASKIAINSTHKNTVRLIKEEKITPDMILKEAIYYAHKAIRNKASGNISFYGMGSTIVAAYLTSKLDTLWIAHVGDSRAYIFHNGELKLLTEDHTLFNQVRLANLLPEDPSKWPSKNILSQALGSGQIIVPDVNKFNINKNDHIILCSDGVTNMIDDKTLSEYLNMSAHPQIICEEIVKAANAKGAKDNITVIIIKLYKGDIKTSIKYKNLLNTKEI